MDIILQKTSSKPNAVKKDIVDIHTSHNCILKEDTSILTPAIVIRGFDNLDDIIGKCNYFYIPKFQRYYFVTDIVAQHAKNISISGKVDVLTTYKSTILNSEQIVSRQENKQNKYIIDNKLPIHSDISIQTQSFGGSFDTSQGNFVLKIAGGV